MTLIIAARLYGIRSIGIDNCAETVKLSKKVIQCLKLENMINIINCCADVALSTIYEGEADPFDQPILDHQAHKITPSNLRKERQQTLYEELLKPKYTVNGFKTAELQRTLRDLFGNSAQIRYEMKKLVVRGAIKSKYSD